MRIGPSRVAAILLAAHAALLGYLTLIMPFTLGPGVKLNLIPFAMMAEDFRLGARHVLLNLIGNLGIFAPVGLLSAVMLGPRATALRVGAIGLGFSLIIEALQWAFGRRVADVDDVILNTTGTLLGYAAVVAGVKLLRGKSD